MSADIYTKLGLQFSSDSDILPLLLISRRVLIRIPIRINVVRENGALYNIIYTSFSSSSMFLPPSLLPSLPPPPPSLNLLEVEERRHDEWLSSVFPAGASIVNIQRGDRGFGVLLVEGNVRKHKQQQQQ